MKKFLLAFQSACAVSTVFLFVVAMRFMYQSGCIADLKTGSRGDIYQALALESQGGTSGLASAVMLALLVATFSQSMAGRVGAVVFSTTVFYMVFFAGSVYFQNAGITSCT